MKCDRNILNGYQNEIKSLSSIKKRQDRNLVSNQRWQSTIVNNKNLPIEYFASIWTNFCRRPKLANSIS